MAQMTCMSPLSAPTEEVKTILGGFVMKDARRRNGSDCEASEEGSSSNQTVVMRMSWADS